MAVVHSKGRLEAHRRTQIPNKHHEPVTDHLCSTGQPPIQVESSHVENQCVLEAMTPWHSTGEAAISSSAHDNFVDCPNINCKTGHWMSPPVKFVVNKDVAYQRVRCAEDQVTPPTCIRQVTPPVTLHPTPPCSPLVSHDPRSLSST